MKWVSVKDRLPEESQEVLAYGYGEIAQAYLLAGNWCGSCSVTDMMKDGFVYDRTIVQQGGAFDFITHWMPLPEKPSIDK